MRLYSYTLRVDDGAAPNPYGGVCTLTICKPTIRRLAKVGDWIVGLGPKGAPGNIDLSSHIIYAMRVSRVLSLANYNDYCRLLLPSKIPQWQAAVPFEHMVGDCIYYPRGGDLAQRPGVHRKENADVDKRGENALLAEEVFYYFGDSPVELPEDLQGIRHNTQGHKVHANEKLKEKFVAWALGGFGDGRHPRILYGQPLHRSEVRPGSGKATWAACGGIRASDPDGEVVIC